MANLIECLRVCVVEGVIVCEWVVIVCVLECVCCCVIAWLIDGLVVCVTD